MPAVKKAAPKAAAPKAAEAKKSAKPSKPVSTTSPMIDTSLAAQAAAQMLAAGLNRPAASSTPKQESAMFKQLKAGLNKPHTATVSNLLEKSHGPEPTKIHPQQKQVGKNQTFGADVTRSGVPRRTPG
jgi:hypothetical protein